MDTLITGRIYPATILAAKLRTSFNTGNGVLVKASGSWSKATSERADAAVDSAADLEAWMSALGPHEEALLTADGRGVTVGLWCTCDRPAAAERVRYEQWSAAGRLSDGYACPTCRRPVTT